MKMGYGFFFLLVALTFLPSCINQISVISNAYADTYLLPEGFPLGSSFCIISANNTNQLLSKEINHKIQNIITELGYYIEKEEQADYYLTFSFSIEQHKTTQNVLKYIPGQTQKTTGNVYRNYENLHYQQTSEASGTYIYVPEEYVYYLNTLYIKVFEANSFRSNGVEEEVWSGSASNSAERADLRKYLDYLLLVVFKKFGKNTESFIQTKLKYDDEKIKKIKNSYFHQKIIDK